MHCQFHVVAETAVQSECLYSVSRLAGRLQVRPRPSSYSVSVPAWMLPVLAWPVVRSPPPPSTSHDEGQEISGNYGSQHPHHFRSALPWGILHTAFHIEIKHNTSCSYSHDKVGALKGLSWNLYSCL